MNENMHSKIAEISRHRENFLKYVKVVGFEDARGFDAVLDGRAVNKDVVGPEVDRITEELLKNDPRIGAIILECTELPPYANMLREKYGIPIFDSLTLIEHFVSTRARN